MPICPFCRKSVENGSVWCSCGANLSRYPNLPVNPTEIKDWLAKHKPEFLESSWSGGSLLDAARKHLINEQEKEIATGTKAQAEVAEAKSLIDSFLLDCEREGLPPTIDIGQLRRDRWRQWKRIPTEYRQHAPLKNFYQTPGYFFETSLAMFKDEYCVALDGTLYKHQLNSPDPFTLEELVGTMPAGKLAEALEATLLWLLKAKQQPGAAETPAQEMPAGRPVTSEAAAGPAPSRQARSKRGLGWPFGRSAGKTTAGVAEEPARIETPAESVGATMAPPDPVSHNPVPTNGNGKKAELHLEKTTT